MINGSFCVIQICVPNFTLISKVQKCIVLPNKFCRIWCFSVSKIAQDPHKLLLMSYLKAAWIASLNKMCVVSTQLVLVNSCSERQVYVFVYIQKTDGEKTLWRLIFPVVGVLVLREGFFDHSLHTYVRKEKNVTTPS